MNRIFATALLLVVLACLVRADDSDSTPDSDWMSESLPLFDGESLAGWEGNAYWFRIEKNTDGPGSKDSPSNGSRSVESSAIVAGRLDEKIPHNEFLCTTQSYDDFELRYEIKLVGEGKNAGVQFRSKRVSGSTEVSGYQADAGEAGNRPVWGFLYDESRRRKMLAEGEPDAVKKSVKTDDWNAMRVVCKGNRIQIFLNGEKTVDYTESDETIAKYGVIGLQIHSGPPTEAWYRNIRVRQF